MVVFKDIEVKVRVDGEDAIEYDDPDPQGNAPLAQKTVIKYIESVDDAEFEFSCKLLPEFVFQTKGVEWIAFVDGRWECGKLSSQEHRDLDRVLQGNLENDYDGTISIRRFKFSSVKIIEGADHDKTKADTKRAEKFGELELQVRRYTSLGPTRYGHHSGRGTKGFEIAEKALKGRALTHATSYGEKINVADKGTVIPKYFGNDDKDPFIRFIFRYRSKDALRSEMIIPREATPETGQVPAAAPAPLHPRQVNVDELSIEELRRLARAQLESSQLVEPIEPEGEIKSEPVIKPERGIKRERIKDPVVTIDLEAPPKKHRKTSMNNPVDLTSDSD